MSRCDHCGKAFVDERSLMRHAKIHADNKPFPCPHCEKGYVDANSLKKHMRNHECEVIIVRYNSIDNKPYPCPNCEKGYVDTPTH